MKTTNKFLLYFFIILTLLITAFAIPKITGFTKIISRSSEIDLNNIKCLEVDGYFRVYTFKEYRRSYFENTPWPDLEKENIIIERSGDTLKIKVKNSKNPQNDRFNRLLSLRTDNLKYIKASTGTSVNCDNPDKENLRVITEGHSNVFLRGGKINNAVFEISDNGYVNTDTCTNVNIKMSGGSFIRLISIDGIIKGELKNTSYIELNGRNVDTKRLVKKDSSAIIYRIVDQIRISY